MEALLESLKSDWDAILRMAPRAAFAVVLLIVLIWIGRLAGRGIVRLLERGKLPATHKNFFRHLVTWTFALIGVLFGLNLLGFQSVAAGLMAGGGVTAVVVGFAFRQIGENLLAGFFLAFSRPFDIGDLIQSGEFNGFVREIALRYTHIRTNDGRDVYIPSAQIFNEPLINFTRDGLRRMGFVIGIDYANDSERARTILLETVTSTDRVLSDPAPSVANKANLDQYQEIEVAFWVDMFKPDVDMPSVRSVVMERCRRALKAEGFTLSSEVSTAVELLNPPA